MNQDTVYDSTCTRQFFVTFLGRLSDPFKWFSEVSDLRLGYKKVTLNHLARNSLNKKNSPQHTATIHNPFLKSFLSQRVLLPCSVPLARGFPMTMITLSQTKMFHQFREHFLTILDSTHPIASGDAFRGIRRFRRHL